jgi:hypothetical protein
MEGATGDKATLHKERLHCSCSWPDGMKADKMGGKFNGLGTIIMIHNLRWTAER